MLRFVETCPACPEQYDVMLNDTIVGYVRLRYSRLTVYYPNIDGVIVYEHLFSDGMKGRFESESERQFYMNLIQESILGHMRSMEV